MTLRWKYKRRLLGPGHLLWADWAIEDTGIEPGSLYAITDVTDAGPDKVDLELWDIMAAKRAVLPASRQQSVNFTYGGELSPVIERRIIDRTTAQRPKPDPA